MNAVALPGTSTHAHTLAHMYSSVLSLAVFAQHQGFVIAMYVLHACFLNTLMIVLFLRDQLSPGLSKV